jgi:hypothetical protein
MLRVDVIAYFSKLKTLDKDVCLPFVVTSLARRNCGFEINSPSVSDPHMMQQDEDFPKSPSSRNEQHLSPDIKFVTSNLDHRISLSLDGHGLYQQA